ncbi:CinA family protein [Herpetosiphon giganteus]|uniref:CinA family protein n=1 Tax=Herpetosiphon giganteus TaxID=2029754 RepID=UPI00195F0533|nr:CinA family protein [Herpetosiphon giganteus]MBM7843744.1 PncC family amidohydrolase [Herpetosiphon giganteus]
MSHALAQAVITALAQRQWTLATAESCTGGLLGDWLTNIAGSSVVYLGGIIAYANSAKQQLLHVPASTLATVGAVSAETALAMAQGTAQALGATVGLSTTGIAGPGGGSTEKPVGLVYLGLALPNQALVEQQIWPYDRLGNKQASAQRALEWLLEQLNAA